MNTSAPRRPSRFVRGRARGGGAYRPYFYFRRNGRTIPATKGHNHDAAAGAGAAPNRKITTRGRGRSANANANSSVVRPAILELDSTFLRPECYAAPEDALHSAQSISTDSPAQCPGWRLYFPKETHEAGSELAKRIKAVETHFSEHGAAYDLLAVQGGRCFALEAKVITADEALMQVWPSVVHDLRLHPQRTLATLGVAMYSAVTLAAIDNALSLSPCTRTVYVPRYAPPKKIYVRPVGFIDAQSMPQADRTQVDQLFCVRGTVAAIGSVEAAASWIAYRCERCRQEQALRQSGYFVARPYSCKRDGCLEKKHFVEQRSSPFTRIMPIQTIHLTENSLQLPDLAAAMPRSLAVELRYDLADCVVSGQDVIVTGILKIRALADDQESISPQTEMYLKAVSVIDAKRTPHAFTERDLEAIGMINSEPDSFKLLVHSIAPELYGQEIVKAGVLLSLFGGAGSQVHDESDINVLLVGDPGIGKSHLLQMCSSISARGAMISGKSGSTAANALTVAIQGRSNYTIYSGAIAAGTDGHCVIDDIDRLASQQETLLQVLQSQVICLPFPSICANIVTPTSIIASANSLRGHYDHSRLLTENTRVSPALLRQFHLTYLLLDKPNKVLDSSLAEHIRAVHAGAKNSATITARFDMKPKVNNSMTTCNIDEEEADSDYMLGERLKLKCVNGVEQEELDLLPPILIRKFIAYARQKVRPLLTAETAAALKDFYMSLRQTELEQNRCGVNSSHFEGLIRLTQARARIDFASEATVSHLRDVICLVRHSIADTSLSDYVDTNAATAAAASASTSQRSSVKRFLQMLQLRSSALGRRMFDLSELKEIASRAGITCGVSNVLDTVNLQGYLLKKGPDLYEVMEN